jgi:hypothetical protein
MLVIGVDHFESIIPTARKVLAPSLSLECIGLCCRIEACNLGGRILVDQSPPPHQRQRLNRSWPATAHISEVPPIRKIKPVKVPDDEEEAYIDPRD